MGFQRDNVPLAGFGAEPQYKSVGVTDKLRFTVRHNMTFFVRLSVPDVPHHSHVRKYEKNPRAPGACQGHRSRAQGFLCKRKSLQNAVINQKESKCVPAFAQCLHSSRTETRGHRPRGWPDSNRVLPGGVSEGAVCGELVTCNCIIAQIAPDYNAELCYGLSFYHRFLRFGII